MKFVEFADHESYQPHSGKQSKKIAVQCSTVTTVTQKTSDATVIEFIGGGNITVAGTYEEVKQKLEAV